MAAGAALVGREHELADVVDVLTSAGGTPRLLVVAGEAGVGKTHLIRTAIDHVAVSGGFVLRGWCLDLASPLPFLPIVDSLRDLARFDAGRLLKEVIASCPPFVEQELFGLLPELADESVPPLTAGALNADWRRERMFAALRAVLVAAGEVVPLGVVLEDVHWADPSTRDLLRYLSVPSHGTGVPIVLTTRTEARGATWLDELVAAGNADYVRLAPLDEQHTCELVRALGAYDADDIRRIYLRSGGNPLFVEHLLAADSAESIPATLEGLLLRRVVALEPVARDVVRGLAVIDRPVDDDVLAELVGGAPGTLGDAVRSVVADGLVDRVAGGDLQVHHALLSEVVRRQMTAVESRQVHSRAAAALARRDDPAIAGNVAEHFAAIGDKVAESGWRLRAARYADTVSAPVESCRQWARLVELSHADVLPDGLRLVDLYLDALSALERANDGEAEAELAGEALERLTPEMEPAEQVRVYYELGRYRAIVDQDGSRPLLQRAVDVGETLPASRYYVLAMQQLAGLHNSMNHGEYAEQLALMVRAQQAAKDAGLRPEEKLTTVSLAWRVMSQGDRAHAVELIDSALALTLDPPDPRMDVGVAVWATDVMLKLGDLDRVVAIGRAAIDAARRVGFPHTFDFCILHANAIEALRERGRSDDIAVMLQVIGDDPPTRSAVIEHMDRAALSMAQGDLAAADHFWTTRASQLTEWGLQYDREIRLLRDEFLLWAGRAEEVVPDALPVLESLAQTEESRMAGGLFVLALRACADRAEAVRAAADPAGLQPVLRDGQQLAALVERCVNHPFTDHPAVATASADGASWHAEWARLMGDSDPAAWAACADTWTLLGRPHRVAYARWRQAEAILADPAGRAAARAVLREASEAARGHLPISDAVLELARRARFELTEEPATVVEPAQSPFGLTERELAVLDLVGRGLTNNEIGSRLFISPKTASAHVSNILRKLQVTSRVQAAAIAARLGLTGSGL